MYGWWFYFKNNSEFIFSIIFSIEFIHRERFLNHLLIAKSVLLQETVAHMM